MEVATCLRAGAIRPLSWSRWQYSVVSEQLYQFDLGKYHTYGIQVIAPGCTDILHDVSVCKDTVKLIVEILNRNHVSPVHLRDVVMDLLP